MSVYLTIPSARPPAEANPVLQRWRDAGYKIALWRDADDQGLVADIVFHQPVYPGYAEAVNQLVRLVMDADHDADWFVAAGDDVLPDPNNRAYEIAKECYEYFAALHAGPDAAPGVDISTKSITAALIGIANSTFGVMQPTGDRFAGGSIDRICGSAWIGREFANRAYQGKGPLWPAFTHMFVDEHLQAVAQTLGIFWQRRALVQLHRHYQRESDALDSPAVDKPIPEHMKKSDAYTKAHWDKSRAIFDRLKAGGFREAFDLLPAQTS